MSVNVNLRVVGIYFGASPTSSKFSGTGGGVVLNVPDNPTVARVMYAAFQDAANGRIQNVNAFNYNGYPDCNFIGVSYSKLPPHTSGYKTGNSYVFQLSDSGANAGQLQYYHYREVNGDFVQLNTNNSFIPYIQTPDPKILDGDYIVWRQVSIISQTNGNARVLSRLKKEPMIGAEQASK